MVRIRHSPVEPDRTRRPHSGDPTLADFVLAHEPVLRFAAFVSVFAVMAFWEIRAPRRSLSMERRRRWSGNIGIALINTLLLRLIFPTAAVGMAVLCELRGWGLLPILGIPPPLGIVLAVLLLDLAVYLQHVVFHAVPVLWRLHRMHHADLEFDITTGIRFHPIEILLSMAIKIGVVGALGAPALAVLIFEILLNATTMFNHGNVHIPLRLDRGLRWLLVTPDMHRVHHSVVRRETNSNFGFTLAWWDRMFGTYRDQPETGHEAIRIGIEAFRNPRELRLDRMLVQPLQDERSHTTRRTGGDR